MTQPAISTQPTTTTTVTPDEYMSRYAHDFYEWVRGAVIKMSPVTANHDRIVRYVGILFAAYLDLKPIGTLRQAPFVMRLDAIPARREPDLQLILHSNPGTLTETYMHGPADICVEVVSEESVPRDYGEKFAEYEKSGVGEYWLIDPLRQLAHFYRLNEEGIYQPAALDEQGNYTTPVLPRFRLHVPALWGEKLPGFYAVARAVEQMLAEDEN